MSWVGVSVPSLVWDEVVEGKSSVVRELVRTLLDGDDDLTCKDLVEEAD